MRNTFNPQEIVNIAINIEENGKKLYEILETKAKNKKVKAVCRYLKEQEEVHLKFFQEMLGNAIKYSKAQHISISLFIGDGQTVLQVEDDGIGFDYNEERHGQGFPNMAERAAKLKGEFSYESEKGFGTKLKFVV